MIEPERDPEITQRYRELAREEPPPALDAGILAAAARELELRPAPLVAPTARRHWYVPLAAAAVIVLSVAVTLHLQREQPDAELELPGQPAPVAPPAPVARPQAEPTRDAVKEPAAAPRQETETRAARATGAKPFPESAPPASPAPPAAAPTSGVAPRPQAVDAQPGAARDVAGQSAAEGAARAAHEELSPEAWLARIIEMRRAGRHAQADESYAAFRRRYPDYRIPEALRDQVMAR